MKSIRQWFSGKQPMRIQGWWVITISRQVKFPALLFNSVFPRMKTSSIVLACLALTLTGVQAQVSSLQASANQSTPTASELPVPTDYRVVDRGPNHRVWQNETYEKTPDGKIITRVHKFTELASGLHYQQNGQWVEAKEKIEVFAGGAIARQGQHQVIFANNLNSYGAIDMQTPDGKRLRSNRSEERRVGKECRSR